MTDRGATTEPVRPDPEPGSVAGPAARSRRDVLAVAGVGVVGAGLLAACGGSDTAAPAATTTPAGTAPASTAPADTGPASTAPASAGTTAAAGPTSAAAPNGFSVPVSAVPVGGGTIYPDEKLVVTQPTKGTFKAFSAVCPHQGCIVAAVQNGQIQCACHASAFDDATGARLSGPAPTGLTAEQVTVTGSTITVAT